jgi:serralysin
MSYFGAWNTGGAPIDWRYSGGVFYDNSPQGPMLHDIYTIQSIYGADPTTRLGDTTYGFNSNAGNDLYDFTKNPLPFYAVYDAGGSNDTIDLSGFKSSQYLNLNSGAFSSIGDVTQTQEQLGHAVYEAYLQLGTDLHTKYTDTQLGAISLGWLAGAKADNAASILADTGVSGIGTVNYENFAIAYGTTIENAIGGQGRDLLVGNAADNHLTGGKGNDVLVGNGGADTFIFANDGSTDTVKDFTTGVDKIDLHNIAGATLANTTYNATTHVLAVDVDHNGVTDLSIVVLGNAVNLSTDVMFHA